MATRHAVIDSTLGPLTLVAEDDRLTGLYFRHHWHRPPAEAFGRRADPDDDALLRSAQDQLAAYLAGERRSFDLPTTSRGDAVQLRVWSLLGDIGYGDTMTYGELAAALGDGSTARDVGQAVGRNPLSIVVPCHRVVGKNDTLTGYAGGLARKRFLLDLEASPESRAARLF